MNLSNLFKLPTPKHSNVFTRLLINEPDAYDGAHFLSELENAAFLGHDLPQSDVLPDAHEIDCDAKEIKCYEFVEVSALDVDTQIRYSKFKASLRQRGWNLRLLLVNKNGVPYEKFSN